MHPLILDLVLSVRGHLNESSIGDPEACAKYIGEVAGQKFDAIFALEDDLLSEEEVVILNQAWMAVNQFAFSLSLRRASTDANRFSKSLQMLVGETL